MLETPDDIAQLQALLDESYAGAGPHLASIHTAETRITADQLVAHLQGMQVFVVATVTSDGRPRTGPVDCFLYRGQLRFGTAATAVRARHLARSPAVSATHVRGESLVVTCHGTVELLDVEGADRDFAVFLRRHYGDENYDGYLGHSPYYRILPDQLFAADMSAHAPPTSSP